MTVKASEMTTRQTKLLGEFIKALQAIKERVLGLALAYKACVDGGIDMSPEALKHLGVTRKLLKRLDKLASGRLVEEASSVLLQMPDAMIETLAQLPKDVQRDLLKNGVPLLRDDRAIVVAVDELHNGEARQIVDRTGGRARLLTPDEQRERQEPIKPRKDKLVQLRFTPAEYAELARKAHKAGHSVEHYLKRQLYLEGILDSSARKRTEGAQATA
jgi:hypothetical protein